MNFPFNPVYFALGLFLGLLYTWFKKQTPEIVYKYPTPDNAGHIVYRDQAGVCYKYRAQKVECPNDLAQAMQQPVQV